jgi:hypothetical protein
MLGSRQGGGSAPMDEIGSSAPKAGAPRAPAKQAPNMSEMDDDIPF